MFGSTVQEQNKKIIKQQHDSTFTQYFHLKLCSLPLYFFGITGNEEAQGPLLHFHVVSRVYQGAARIYRPNKKKSQLKITSGNLQGFTLII